jgi:catalase
MEGVPSAIKIRAIARFYQADSDCGIRLANAMHYDIKIIEQEVLNQKRISAQYSQECKKG